MRTKTQQELIDIIRFEIRGIPLPDGFNVSDEKALTDIAKKHDLTHLVYDALTKNGLPCGSQFAMQQYYASIWRAEQMAHELSSMTELFESEGIDFMPLKGAVMRQLYPEPWMRTSADIDILFKEEDINQSCELLTTKCDYIEDKDLDSPHHISFNVPSNGVHIEIHRKLFVEYHMGQTVRDMMPLIWQQADPEHGYAHLLRMSDACFYLYHTAHMAKHLSQAGGCPIRGLIDLWILNGLSNRDEIGRRELLERAGLLTFADKMSAVADSWLDNGKVPSEDLEQFIMTGSLYGDTKMRTATAVNAIGTVGYAFRRIFLPYDVIKYSYPVLQKCKILTPLYQIVRWTKVFRRENRHRLKDQTAALISTNREQVEEINKMNKFLGIEDLGVTSV